MRFLFPWVYISRKIAVTTRQNLEFDDFLFVDFCDPGIENPENIYEIFRKSLCIFIQSWIYSSKEEISFQSLSNNCTKVSLRFNCGKTNFLTRASIGIIHLGPKFRGKRLWSRLDSCDLKDFRSKVKDIFIVKMSLTFQNLSRDIKLESLVPFDYKIRAFLLSRDEFWKV